MDLLALILSDIDAAQARPATLQKWRECLRSLQAYLGDNPLPALQTLSTGWLDGFERFLATAPVGRGSKPLSPATAAAKRAILVAYIREAIKRGFLPNIPVTPGSAQRELLRLAPLDRQGDMHRLLSLFHYKKERLQQGAITDPAQREALLSQTRAIGHCLLAVLLGGMGYEGLLALRTDHLAGHTLHLPHLDVDVTLTDALLEMIQWLAPADGGSRLLFDDSDPVTPDSLRTSVADAIATLDLRSHSAMMHPATQWLEIALALPGAAVSADDARCVIDRLYGVRDDQASADTVVRLFDSVVASLRHLGYAWYCIRVTSQVEGEFSRLPDASAPSSRAPQDQPSRGDMLLALIHHRGMRPVDSFAPHDFQVRDKDGRKEVRKDRFLDSLLFVRVNYIQLEAINRYLMSLRAGFVYADRVDGSLRFAVIPAAELDLLRLFFTQRDGRRIAQADTEALAGMRARIITGIYDGFEGRILRVVYDKQTHLRRLILHIQGDYAEVDYTVDPDYLELLPD